MQGDAAEIFFKNRYKWKSKDVEGAYVSPSDVSQHKIIVYVTDSLLSQIQNILFS
jgi:hypothetical protein